jgi:arylsulfatase A-like enzyme
MLHSVSRPWHLAALLIALSVGGLAACSGGSASSQSEPVAPPDGPNVLLILVDDLRPEVGTYGADAITPNMDALAARGVQFDGHRVNVPTCGPSRATLITGLRGTEERFYRNSERVDEHAAWAEPMSTFFRRNGYAAYGLGKILHTPEDHGDTWSAPIWLPDVQHLSKNYVLPENMALQARSGKNGPITEAADVDDDAYVDGMIARRAASVLEALGESGDPFFLTVGFIRPHLPYSVPQRYWDMYPEGDLPESREVPLGAPSLDTGSGGLRELVRYEGVPEATPFPDSLVRQLRRGYRASVSYVDAQIGRVLDQLEASGLAENTIVLLWGDHGFLLGEHGQWSKHVTLDLALRSPLIVAGPGVNTGVAEGLVETIDIYPTLADLTGLAPPDHLQGESFVPQLRDPAAPGKPAIFSRFRKLEAVLTPTHALTAFTDDGEVVDYMLFDHRTDPQESVNVMDSQPEAAERLTRLLMDHLAQRN